MYKTKPIIVPPDYKVPREQEIMFEILNKSVLLNQILQTRVLSEKLKDDLNITVLKDNLEISMIDLAKELNHLDKDETEKNHLSP